MIEASRFIHTDTTLKISTELGEAIRSNGNGIIDAIGSAVEYAQGALDREKKVTPLGQKKS